MVDAGEDPDHTAQREFLEETMNSEKKNAEELAKLTQLTADILSKGERVTISIIRNFIYYDCSLRPFILFRFIVVMWMILATRTMPGWKLSPSTFTLKEMK